jgi:glyoxylase-like metal-dependent hydrolase (beta-lactamase superfamily II)
MWVSVQNDLALTTALGAGITQIRLPMAGNPLRYINGYLLEDDGGYTLVDCGWKADDVLAALHAALAECGLTLKAVQRLLITHVHFDHYGLAGTLRRAGVPELIMHENDWAFARDYLGDPSALDATADAWISRNGLHFDAVLDDEIQHNRTEVAEPTSLAADRTRIGRLLAVWTPGHTAGHLCYVDTRSGKMLTGDHVLDPITPHVGVWHEHRGDPLGDYIDSLQKVKTIGASGVLPAHGEPFPDLDRRVDQLLAHEETREGQVLDRLATAGSASAADIARSLPWTRKNRNFTELSEAHQQFAVAETIAHLEHLRLGRRVTRDVSGATIVYATA